MTGNQGTILPPSLKIVRPFVCYGTLVHGVVRRHDLLTSKWHRELGELKETAKQNLNCMCPAIPELQALMSHTDGQ